MRISCCIDICNHVIKDLCRMKFNDLKIRTTNLKFKKNLWYIGCFHQEDSWRRIKTFQPEQASACTSATFLLCCTANSVSSQVTAAGHKRQERIMLEISFKNIISSSASQRDDINQSNFKELKEIKVFLLMILKCYWRDQ